VDDLGNNCTWVFNAVGLVTFANEVSANVHRKQGVPVTVPVTLKNVAPHKFNTGVLAFTTILGTGILHP
jgi:hypothetical protein